jgi:pimeloyl-ACP methyl ester carboxylesterase
MSLPRVKLRRTGPAIWRESRLGIETAALLRDPVFRGEGVAEGRGQPVLLIPGFMAGDDSLALMTRWLRRTGHHTGKAGIRMNVGCSGKGIDRLEQRLEQLVERQGQRAAVIGQSRGGSFAKVLAQLRPDLVSGIVTLGSPTREPLDVHPAVSAGVKTVALLGGLRVPGLFTNDCLAGDCCSAFWELHDRPLPRGVGFVAVYSKSDGIVNWRACLDPDAQKLAEIRSSHIGMAVHPDGYREIGDALAAFRRRDARAKKPPRRPQLRLVKAA